MSMTLLRCNDPVLREHMTGRCTLTPYSYVLYLCMSICMFGYWAMTQELTPSRGIRDEEIHESAPLVRALLVERYEKLWATCEPHVDGSLGKPDPRFIEAGIRVCDRLAKLYRLDQPVPGSDQPQGDLVKSAELVLGTLRELEARMSDPLG